MIKFEENGSDWTNSGEAMAARLQAQIGGAVLHASSEAYEQARRVWNGVIDRRPMLIARCKSTGDVAACIRFATQNSMPLSVRGGGHNVAGSALCDDGLVIDLTEMRSVRVDLDARRVFAGGGTTIGDLDRVTQEHGLAVPLGVVTATGIAGLTLGGGLGWMRRKHGLAADALRAATVVTADATVLHASEGENPDLFWAIRGGGGNFGVVTEFEYEMYELGPEVFQVFVIYPYEQAHAVLERMRDYMSTAPDEFSPLAVLGPAPPVEQLDEHLHGKPCVVVVGPYIGGVDAGRAASLPLRALGTPLADLSGPTPYLEVQQFFDADYPDGLRYFWKSIQLDELSAEAISQLIAISDESPSSHSTVDVWFQGGALARVDAEATGFGDRSAPIAIGIEANWHEIDDDAASVMWARRAIDGLQPYSSGGMYLNFPGTEEEGAQRLEETYGGNYKRLARIKAKYDPHNVFRTHQNIKPLSETLS